MPTQSLITQTEKGASFGDGIRMRVGPATSNLVEEAGYWLDPMFPSSRRIVTTSSERNFRLIDRHRKSSALVFLRLNGSLRRSASTATLDQLCVFPSLLI